MKSHKQQGAVSIFIVIFTALLVTIVTAGFIQIMLRNQEQATNTDLSQSAYDSALAGVEDAKRALVKLRECEADAADPCENALATALEGQACESLGQTGAGVTTFDDGEVQVGDGSLNQAYSCVKVQLDTDSVQGDLTGDDDTTVVPLRGVSGYDRIRVSWFTAADLPSGVTLPTFTVNPFNLTSVNDWPDSQPGVLRTQLIQFSRGSISLADFDSKNTAHAKTRFLFPSVVGTSTGSFTSDQRRNSAASRNTPLDSRCAANFSTTEYLCSVTLTLPAMANREAYLQLASFYNDAHFKIELLNGASVVLFDNVQPVVDATGRASDLFRRVKARVSVTDGGSSLQFPDAALNVRGNLCKDFFVTDDTDDYSADTNGAECEP